MSTILPGDYFDGLYQQQDPFGYRSRWYEARKREILLATLPRARYAKAWELGCSNGEVSFGLARRCEKLLATDLSDRAVELAKTRLAQCGNVEVIQADHPKHWPRGSFDLIVVSEVGYYLEESDLADLIERAQDSLVPEGLLLACHWKHVFAEAHQDGVAVHRQFNDQLSLPPAYRYEDSDFLLEAWTAHPLSVAQQEGLR